MTNTLFQNSASPQEAESSFLDFCKNYKTAFKKDFSPQDNPDLLVLFGNSKFLVHQMINHPEFSLAYQKSNYRDDEKPLAIFQKEIQRVMETAKNDLKEIKKYKYQEYVRLTIKELKNKDQPTTYREFSHLAFALTECVLENILTEMQERHALQRSQTGDFSLLAMGKLGGLELNYSSDIDLIGLYDTEGNLNSITKHEFYEKVFSKLGQTLTTQDEHGFLFRVDWDLRPEGKSGALANSIDALENYYETFGEEWERQAFIKAHVMYEKEKIGCNFLSDMNAFIYRKTFDEKTVKKIWNVKSRIIEELHEKNHSSINIKLEKGGIRDIEFFIQGFQLIYGGKIFQLQTANTLHALDALEKHGLITKEARHLLKQAYLLLRKVESCLQMENEQQTHRLKPSENDILKIARRMGITLKPIDAVNHLREKLEQTMSAVSTLFQEIYGR